MKKIFLSLLSIGAVAGVAVLATGAFFSDTEESVGNTLVAGAIDLKVDNTCYYNGQACSQWPDHRFYWGGQPDNPEHPEQSTNLCSCTWESKDLDEGDLFFELFDIKPGDWEEDTISLTVESNEAWLCADVQLTSDLDVDCTEPELESTDSGCDPNGPHDGGELADRVNFLWWADDGDNVLECVFENNVCNPHAAGSENTLPAGPLGVLGFGVPANVTLADSSFNIWSGLTSDPIPQGGDTWYIGKGWCFGTLIETPVPQDEFGATGTNGPDSQRGGGFSCNGSGEGNETQTDRLTANIAFRAVQARNNSPFSCQTVE